MDIRGSAERLRAETGWVPEIPLERTVADALEAWRVELRLGRRSQLDRAERLELESHAVARRPRRAEARARR